jgi:hypothetical protein
VEEHSPERRLLVAFTLAIVVFLGWGAYMRYRYPAPPVPAEAPPVAEAPAPPPTTPAPQAAKEPAGPSAMLQGGVQAKEDSEERTFRIETDTATIELSNRGAVVRSWKLKNYRDPKGNPLELVQGGTTGLGWPLSFSVANPEQEEKLNSALYVVNQTPGTLEAPAELTFEWSDGQVVARKQLRFSRDGLCEIRTAIAAPDNPVEHQIAWRGGFGEHAVADSSRAVVPSQVFVRSPDGLKRQLAQQAGKPPAGCGSRRRPSLLGRGGLRRHRRPVFRRCLSSAAPGADRQGVDRFLDAAQRPQREKERPGQDRGSRPRRQEWEFLPALRRPQAA